MNVLRLMRVGSTCMRASKASNKHNARNLRLWQLDLHANPYDSNPAVAARTVFL